MSEILRVTWRVTPLHPPRPWRHCSSCNSRMPFRSSGNFRTNAQKKRIDVWLIYRCAACGETWNLPVIERLPVTRIPPDELQAFAGNDPASATRHAFDLTRLARHSDRLEHDPSVSIDKHRDGGNPHAAQVLEIAIALDLPCRWRLDRLLARELGIARPLLRTARATDALKVTPAGRNALREPIVDGQQIWIDLRSTAPWSAEIRRAVARL